jgi:ATP-dependent RNA helicase SUPV3L1/SUV3
MINRSIKRIIFESTMKNNGTAFVPLEISEIKQIAGRAGRFRTAHEAIAEDQTSSARHNGEQAFVVPYQESMENRRESTIGYATTLENVDFRYLKETMTQEPPIIKSAGILPPSLIVERFSSYFPPGTPFSYILLRLHEISTLHPRFYLCTLKDQLGIADVIHPIRNLSVQERLTITAAPTNVREQSEKDFLFALAKCVADNESGDLLDLPHLPLEILEQPMSGARNYLYELEQLHKMLVLYLWLSYRFPNVFTTRALANKVKHMVEDKIEATLKNFNFVERYSAAVKKRREAAREILRQFEKRQVDQPEQNAIAEIGEDNEGDCSTQEFEKRQDSQHEPEANESTVQGDPKEMIDLGSRRMEANEERASQ